MCDKASYFMFSVDDVSEHSDIVDNEEVDGASVGDEDNDEELEGAVGGAMLFSTPERQESQESPNPERKQTSLLDELQKEIDRLHLLNPGGMFLYYYTGATKLDIDILCLIRI